MANQQRFGVVFDTEGFREAERSIKGLDKTYQKVLSDAEKANEELTKTTQEESKGAGCFIVLDTSGVSFCELNTGWVNERAFWKVIFKLINLYAFRGIATIDEFNFTVLNVSVIRLRKVLSLSKVKL